MANDDGDTCFACGITGGGHSETCPDNPENR